MFSSRNDQRIMDKSGVRARNILHSIYPEFKFQIYVVMWACHCFYFLCSQGESDSMNPHKCCVVFFFKPTYTKTVNLLILHLTINSYLLQASEEAECRLQKVHQTPLDRSIYRFLHKDPSAASVNQVSLWSGLVFFPL